MWKQVAPQPAGVMDCRDDTAVGGCAALLGSQGRVLTDREKIHLHRILDAWAHWDAAGPLDKSRLRYVNLFADTMTVLEAGRVYWKHDRLEDDLEVAQRVLGEFRESWKD